MHIFQKEIFMDRSQELDFFKSNIDLSLYAETFSFQRDSIKSSKNNIVMKSGADTVIISLNRNTGHWQYFNSQNDTDRGTIIEFIQNRTSLNLGQVRIELRAFSNTPQSSGPEKTVPKIKGPSKINISRVQGFLKHRKQCISNDYLQSRNINIMTIQAPVFNSRILEGYKGAVIFPHFNKNGICGYEVNNVDFKHFPETGEKGLWLSRSPKLVDNIVFTESPIEALSYFQYFNFPANVLLASGSGNWSKDADSLIMQLIMKHPDSKVVAAFNNDKGGQIQYKRLSNILENVCQLEKCFPPEEGSDWNLMLRRKLNG